MASENNNNALSRIVTIGSAGLRTDTSPAKLIPKKKEADVSETSNLWLSLQREELHKNTAAANPAEMKGRASGHQVFNNDENGMAMAPARKIVFAQIRVLALAMRSAATLMMNKAPAANAETMMAAGIPHSATMMLRHASGELKNRRNNDPDAAKMPKNPRMNRRSDSSSAAQRASFCAVSLELTIIPPPALSEALSRTRDFKGREEKPSQPSGMALLANQA